MIKINSDLSTDELVLFVPALMDLEGLNEWYKKNVIDEVTHSENPFALIEQSFTFSTVKSVCEMSKLYPNAIIQIDYFSSNPLDNWRRYIKDGKTQLCLPRVEYDGYSPNLFKDLDEEEVRLQYLFRED